MARLFVGNVAYDATVGELRSLFEAIGEVSDCTIITDRQTGQSKGYGFVEFVDPKNAKEAIGQLNGTTFHGRNLTVNEAQPREPRGGGGGRGRGPR